MPAQIHPSSRASVTARLARRDRAVTARPHPAAITNPGRKAAFMPFPHPCQHHTRRRWNPAKAVLSITVGALAVSAVGSSAAYAQEGPIGDSVVSLMHGKCLEAEDAPGAPSMPRVRMMRCSPTNLNQRWT
jgi:hypothetical protein